MPLPAKAGLPRHAGAMSMVRAAAVSYRPRRRSCMCPPRVHHARAHAHGEPKAGPLPALVPPSPLLPCSGGRNRRQPCRRVRNLERRPRPCFWPTLLPVRARPCPKPGPFACLMAGDEPPLSLDITAALTLSVVTAPMP